MEHEGDRYDERPEEQASGEQDWYFDLPSGAWERQKQVHQRLREQLLANEREKEPERDPFTGLPIEPRGLFGRFRRKKPRLPEELERELKARQRERGQPADAPPQIEYSTEPSDWGLRTDARPLLRREPAPPPPADETGTPRSKWDEFFGSGLAEENPLEAMRRWAKGEPLNEPDEHAEAAEDATRVAEEPGKDERAPEDEGARSAFQFPSFGPWEEETSEAAALAEGAEASGEAEPEAVPPLAELAGAEQARSTGAEKSPEPEAGSGTLDFPSFAPWPEAREEHGETREHGSEDSPAARWRQVFGGPHHEETSLFAREPAVEETEAPESDREEDGLAAMRRWARGEPAPWLAELSEDEGEPAETTPFEEPPKTPGKRFGFFARFRGRHEPEPPDAEEEEALAPAAEYEAGAGEWLPADEPHAEAPSGDEPVPAQPPAEPAFPGPQGEEPFTAPAGASGWAEEGAAVPSATGEVTPAAVPVPAPTDEDDPWAEWLAASSAEEPAPIPDAARASAEPEPEAALASSLGEDRETDGGEHETGSVSAEHDGPWAAFASLGAGDEASEPEAEPEDPWGALAEATGYDERAEAPPPPMRSSEVHRRSGDWLADQFPPADGVFQEEGVRQEERSEQATESEVPAEQAAARTPASPAEREWQPWRPEASEETEPDEDVILKAFEEHAASAVEEDEEPDLLAPELTGGGRRRLSLRDLLGEEAEDIVAELEDEEEQPGPFAEVHGWAPQRAGVLEGAQDEGGLSQEPEPAAARPQRASSARSTIRFIVQLAISAALVILLIRASTQTFRVDGTSMWPTLSEQDWVVVNTLAYQTVDLERLSTFLPFIDPGEDGKAYVFGPPQRGDIIVFQDPTDPSTDLIKRIIALPGEKVEIIDGHVYINDRLLEEPYIQGEWHGNRPAAIVPDGHYFVLGDNRDNSKDSRSPQIGYVPEDLIIGKAMFIVWPRGHFGLAPNDSGQLTDIPAPSLSTMRTDGE